MRQMTVVLAELERSLIIERIQAGMVADQRSTALWRGREKQIFGSWIFEKTKDMLRPLGTTAQPKPNN